MITEIELSPRTSDIAAQQAEEWVSDAQSMFRHVTIRSEPALMLRWDKGAEACFDGGGRLQIWTPDIVCDEKGVEGIESLRWKDEWRELFTAKGARYGFQPLATARGIEQMCAG